MKYIRKMEFRDYVYHHFIFFAYKIPKYCFHKISGKDFIHFIHIPKTGGTALKVALKDSLVYENTIILLHSHFMKLSYIPDGDKVFFFVRDPITRFVSAFNMRKRMLTRAHRKYLLPHDIEIFKAFDSAEEVAEALTSADESRSAMARETLNTMFFVKDGMSEWLISVEYLRRRADSILFIGRQEKLGLDFLKLKTLLGLNEGISLPSDPVTSNSSQESNKPLSSKAIENLREYFAKEYEILLICEKIRDQIILNIDKDSHEKHKNT